MRTGSQTAGYQWHPGEGRKLKLGLWFRFYPLAGARLCALGDDDGAFIDLRAGFTGARGSLTRAIILIFFRNAVSEWRQNPYNIIWRKL